MVVLLRPDWWWQELNLELVFSLGLLFFFKTLGVALLLSLPKITSVSNYLSVHMGQNVAPWGNRLLTASPNHVPLGQCHVTVS